MSPQRLRPVTVIDVGQVHVIELHGELDGQALTAFEADVDATLGIGRRAFVIDLRDAGFVASAVVNAIFRVCRVVRGAVGATAVVCTDTHALRILELTRLDQAVAVYATLEDAIRAVSPE